MHERCRCCCVCCVIGASERGYDGSEWSLAGRQRETTLVACWGWVGAWMRGCGWVGGWWWVGGRIMGHRPEDDDRAHHLRQREESRGREAVDRERHLVHCHDQHR